MKSIQFLILALAIFSCKRVAVNENLFCINPELTEEELLDMGYELREGFQPGSGNYKNVPLNVERSGKAPLSSNAKHWQYVENELDGKLIEYHIDGHKIYGRSVYYINNEFKVDGAFSLESLDDLMLQENCICEVLSIDKFKSKGVPTVYYMNVINSLNQKHSVKLSNSYIDIDSYYQRDSSGNVIAITPPPARQ